MTVRIVVLIARKGDGGELAAEELAALIAADTPDYQLAAVLMAVVLRGMSGRETADLMRAMVGSGARLDLTSVGRPVADKHSTGGVGDKTTLVVAPLVAACGVPVAKLSGRGLGHTGGTLDKLESIPGFEVDLEPQRLIDQVRRALPVPITGVVSDGQGSIRNAEAQALKGVPHQLCHFHYPARRPGRSTRPIATPRRS